MQKKEKKKEKRQIKLISGKENDRDNVNLQGVQRHERSEPWTQILNYNNSKKMLKIKSMKKITMSTLISIKKNTFFFCLKMFYCEVFEKKHFFEKKTLIIIIIF